MKQLASRLFEILTTGLVSSSKASTAHYFKRRRATTSALLLHGDIRYNKESRLVTRNFNTRTDDAGSSTALTCSATRLNLATLARVW